MNLKAVLEGLLFVVGDEGLSIGQLAGVLEIDEDEAKKLIISLKEEYENSDKGLRISFLGNNYKMTTKPEHKAYYERLVDNQVSNTLSQSALEILAIIVYNEPITRVQVDAIRGVSSAQMMRKLVAKGFIKDTGRSELPGRPILYKTTNEFLDYFGLSSIDELPKLEASNEEDVNEETNLFLARYQEDN